MNLHRSYQSNLPHPDVVLRVVLALQERAGGIIGAGQYLDSLRPVLCL